MIDRYFLTAAFALLCVAGPSYRAIAWEDASNDDTYDGRVAVVDVSFLLEEDRYGYFSLSPHPTFDHPFEQGKKQLGSAFVSPIAAQVLLTEGGVTSVEGAAAVAGTKELSKSKQFITKSTDEHIDMLLKSGDVLSFLDSRVAFVPLETNPNAHFDIEDTCLPIRRGRMVVFNGRSPHRTVIRSDSPSSGKHGTAGVSFLGAFQMSTFLPISEPLTDSPTLVLSSNPSALPSGALSEEPSSELSSEPSVFLSSSPSVSFSSVPSVESSSSPSVKLSITPTLEVSATPSLEFSNPPTADPVESSSSPSVKLSSTPTLEVSATPSFEFSNPPTADPTDKPTTSFYSSGAPTENPTKSIDSPTLPPVPPPVPAPVPNLSSKSAKKRKGSKKKVKKKNI